MGRNRSSDSSIVDLSEGVILFQRPNSAKWYCRVTLPGKRGRQEFSTRTTALETAKETARERANDILYRHKRNMPLKELGFDEVAKRFVRNRETAWKIGEIKEERYMRCKRVVEGYFLEYFWTIHRKSITDIKNNDVLNYQEWRLTKGLGNRGTVSRADKKPGKGTIRMENTWLRRLFHFAHQEGFLHHTEIPVVKNDYSGLRASRRPHFTLDEWQTISDWLERYVEGPYSGNFERFKPLLPWELPYRKLARDLIEFIAFSGIRPGKEVYTLKWQDISIEEINDDKGHYLQGTIHITEGKTGERTILGSPELVEVLMRRKRESDFTRPTDYVFCHPIGTNQGKDAEGKPYQSPQSVWRRTLDETGTLYNGKGQKRTLYSLRHSYITAMLASGVRAQAVQKQAGHSDLSMISRFYDHSEIEQYRAELNRSPFAKR